MYHQILFLSLLVIATARFTTTRPNVSTTRPIADSCKRVGWRRYGDFCVKNFGLTNLFSFANNTCTQQNAQILSTNLWASENLKQLSKDLNSYSTYWVSF